MSAFNFVRRSWTWLHTWWSRRGESTRALDRLPVGELDSSLVFRAAMLDLLTDRRSERRSKNWRGFMYFLMFALPMLVYGGMYAWSAGLRFGPANDVVGVVRLEGEMADGALASAERGIPALRKAFESNHVRGVVLSIDSPGGAPLEAERIYKAIETFRKAHPKPVVAVINNLGASAAYMVALHADQIVAGNYSLVGSVGAILSGWDAHQALNRLGLSQRVYASGELKSLMNPFVPMSPQSERKARDLVEQMGGAFVAELKQHRQARLAPGVDFASGGVWGGAEAKRLGLVDEVATIDQVVQSRWPGLSVHEYGPRAGGLPFASTAASWLQDVLAKTIAKPLSLR
jgi:protease IV